MIGKTFFLRLFIASSCILRIQGLICYLEGAEIVYLDPEYFDAESSEVEAIYLNSTFSGLSTNFTVIKQLPDTVMGRFNLYLKSMGDYTVSGGISVSMPLCEMTSEPILMGKILSLLGINDESCPPPPGVYGMPFWSPTVDLLPDSMPGNDYKVSFTADYDGDKVLADLAIYVQVF